MGFKPLAENVLIRIAEVEKTSDHGIIMPNSKKEKPNYGEVLAVGSGTLVKDGTKFPIEVEVGDNVLFKKDAGVPVDVDGVEHL